MKSPQVFHSLIEKAKKIAVRKKFTNDVTTGRVGCVLITKSGKQYAGVNVKMAGDLGFCAEVNVFAQMVNDGENEIEVMVAVNSDGEIIPPCGRCRELLYQLNRNNVHTKIIFSADKSVELEKLLPHRWQEYWSDRV